ncbi:hypothetical protein ACOSP7_023030 [Xanthoceras sorbifolium]
MEFMTSLPPEERVILVGQSMGGFSISAAMERFPERVSVVVSCTAFMPSPDLIFTTYSEQSIHEDWIQYLHLIMGTTASTPLYSWVLTSCHPSCTCSCCIVSETTAFCISDEAASAVTKEKYGSVFMEFILCAAKTS